MRHGPSMGMLGWIWILGLILAVTPTSGGTTMEPASLDDPRLETATFALG